MILEEIKKIKSTRKELKSFGFLIGGILLLVSAYGFWSAARWTLTVSVIGGLFVISGAIFPSILLPIQKIWMVIAVAIVWFMTRVILITLYYIVLTPIGIIYKLLGKDPLNRKFPDEKRSFWIKPSSDDNGSEGIDQQY